MRSTNTELRFGVVVPAGCWLLLRTDVVDREVEQKGKMQEAVCWQFLLKVLISAEKVSKPQRVIDPYHTVTRPLQLHLSAQLSAFVKGRETLSFKVTAQKLNHCFWPGAR